jgi:hypothetical protein
MFFGHHIVRTRRAIKQENDARATDMRKSIVP